jgi:hypothetical protein
MAEGMNLYERDFVAWSEQQAEALRAAAQGRSNQSLDWENLAEEIDGLGISQRQELKSQIRRIIEHLLKLENSHAIYPRAGWTETIEDARNEIEAVLEDSPSLRQEIGAVIATEMGRASRKAVRELGKYEDVEPAALARIRDTTYTDEQVVGDWLPEEPPAGADGL